MQKGDTDDPEEAGENPRIALAIPPQPQRPAGRA